MLTEKDCAWLGVIIPPSKIAITARRGRNDLSFIIPLTLLANERTLLGIVIGLSIGVMVTMRNENAQGPATGKQKYIGVFASKHSQT